MPEPPEWSSIHRMAIDSRVSRVYTAIPGRVVDYDRVSQVADVQPQIKENGESLPILQNVPVCWPRGRDGYLCFDISSDDFGLLVFSKSDIGQWREIGEIVDPGDVGSHGIAGAVFFPGLYPSSATIQQVSNGCVLSHPNKICIGAYNASEPALLGDKENDALETLSNALSAWAGAVSGAITALGGDVTGALSTLNGAISAFKAAIRAAESTKTFLDK